MHYPTQSFVYARQTLYQLSYTPKSYKMFLCLLTR